MQINFFTLNGQKCIFPLQVIFADQKSPEKGEAGVAFVNDDYLVKEFMPKNNGLFLVPKNENYPTICITETDDYKTFGVVI